MTTRLEAMAIYNAARTIDANNMIARGEKDTTGKAIQPWVNLTYDQLAIIVTDQYLLQYVQADMLAKSPPPQPVITAV